MADCTALDIDSFQSHCAIVDGRCPARSSILLGGGNLCQVMRRHDGNYSDNWLLAVYNFQPWSSDPPVRVLYNTVHRVKLLTVGRSVIGADFVDFNDIQEYSNTGTVLRTAVSGFSAFRILQAGIGLLYDIFDAVGRTHGTDRSASPFVTTENLKPRSSPKLLLAGLGTGTTAIRAASVGYSVTAVEISAGVIEAVASEFGLSGPGNQGQWNQEITLVHQDFHTFVSQTASFHEYKVIIVDLFSGSMNDYSVIIQRILSKTAASSPRYHDRSKELSLQDFNDASVIIEVVVAFGDDSPCAAVANAWTIMNDDALRLPPLPMLCLSEMDAPDTTSAIRNILLFRFCGRLGWELRELFIR